MRPGQHRECVTVILGANNESTALWIFVIRCHSGEMKHPDRNKYPVIFVLCVLISRAFWIVITNMYLFYTKFPTGGLEHLQDTIAPLINLRPVTCDSLYLNRVNHV